MKSIWLTIASLSLVTATASATVRREGTWPEHEPMVSLDLHQAPRHEAVRKLADAAGWSIVIDMPVSAGTPIDVKLNGEEAGKVLDVLLRDGNYVAQRDGNIVTIRTEVASASDAGPTAPSVAPARLDDVKVLGGSDRIEKDSVVRSAKVVGGFLEVFGTVVEDLKVVGGAVRLRPGSHVKGDIKIVGGSVQADEGAIVDHRPKVVGGAFITKGSAQGVEPSEDDGDLHKAGDGTFRAGIRRAGNSIMSAITGASLLFLFGIVILTLAKERAELMRSEVASRPMRSLALGAVGIIGVPLVVVLLCVTVIGIPFAAVGVLLLTLGGFAALVCALQVLGEALTRHKTTNPYAHLGLGIALYTVVASLPFIGEWVVFGAILVSLGLFIATRAAGFVKKKGAP